MRNLPFRAQVYIWATMLVGGAIAVWLFTHWGAVPLLEVGIVAILAAAAQVLRVEGATAHSSYEISWVLFGFTFVHFGAPATLFVILAAHGVEWFWHREQKRWYIVAFNMSSFAIVVLVAEFFQSAFIVASAGTDWMDIVGVVVATALFTLLNHLMVGLVLWLARGEPLSHSGVMGRLTLTIDFTTFGLGAVAALVWSIHPLAIILVLTPLYLIYSTLRVPALERQTQIDPKTGLFNARYFNEALEKELARADRYDRPLVVVMADLDLLRNINNTYGHLAGDTALIGVAHLVKKMVREYDIVARFGGEEFGILMPETTYEQAAPRIEEIRAAIQAAEFEITTSVTPLRVTMSFGIATRDRFGLTPNEIVHSADLAVYQAKLAGRNRVCFYSGQGVEDVTTIAPMAPAAPPPAPVAALPAEPAPPAPQAAPPPAPLPQLQAPPAEAPDQRTRPVPVRSRPVWAVNAYITGLLTLTIGLWGLGMVFWPTQPTDWLGLLLFTALAGLTEWLAIDIYVRETSVSTSVAPFVAAAILFGPAGALLISVTMAGVAKLRHGSPVSRFFFNAGNHLMAAMLSVAVARGINLVLGSQPLLAPAVTGMLATLVVYLSSTGLLAGIIDVSSGQSFQSVWKERFRWLWPYYAGLGVVACALIYSYLFNGFLGVAVTLVPLLVLRLGQSQYVDHTKALVTQLRGTNAELLKKSDEISELNEELLLSLSRAIDLRDPDVQDHSQHVARYARLIAQELGLPAERVEMVRKAGLLHDIGKLGIPEAILFKPGRLTPQEYEDIKQHVTMGAEIVGNCHSLRTLVPFIRHHHERYDGAGYPDRLAGHTIPLEARILSVADTIEAMAADRPYRRGLSADYILKEINDYAGSQFDPLVVRAFCTVIEKQGAHVIVNSAREIHAPRPAAQVGPAMETANPPSEAFNALISRLHSREARRYRAVVEDHTDLICRFLPDRTLTFVNEAYCAYFEKSSAELIGQPFMPMIPEEDHALISAHMAALSREAPVAVVEHRVIRPDGAVRWQQWTDRAILNPQGEIIEFQSVGRDITEQREAAQALQAANRELERRNQQLAHILEVGNSLRLSPDLDEVLQHIAEGIEQALGYASVAISLVDPAREQARLAASTGLEPAGEPGAITLTWQQTLRRLLQDRFRAGHAYFIPSGALNWARESPGYVPSWGPAGESGAWQPDDALVVPLTLRSGEIAGLISVDRPADGRRPTAEMLQGLQIFANQAVTAIETARMYAQFQADLAETQQMETALRESEHRYRLVAENISDVIWVRDLNLGSTFVSLSVQKLLGCRPEEALTRTLAELYTPQSAALQEQFLQEMTAAARRNGPELRRFQARRLTLEMRRCDGTTVWTESQLSFLMDELGSPIGILGVTRELSPHN